MAEPEEYVADDEFAEEDDTEDEDEIALDDDLEELDAFEALEDDAEVVPDEVIADEEEDEEDDAEEIEEGDEESEPVEDEEEESLDVLLSRDKIVEDDDLGRLEEPRDGLTITAQPISASEFTCRSCFLVKNRAQLADEERLICFDCV